MRVAFIFMFSISSLALPFFSMSLFLSLHVTAVLPYVQIIQLFNIKYRVSKIIVEYWEIFIYDEIFQIIKLFWHTFFI